VIKLIVIKTFIFQECTPASVNASDADSIDTYEGPAEVKCSNVTKKVCENIPAKIPRIVLVPKYETLSKSIVGKIFSGGMPILRIPLVILNCI